MRRKKVSKNAFQIADRGFSRLFEFLLFNKRNYIFKKIIIFSSLVLYFIFSYLNLEILIDFVYQLNIQGVTM
jgi:hypothetical protein